ncbi:hypothetical protein N7510_008139, partial [Penicillium lagena]|uniref:uncharacterized protein n=1 Tax=Penicillium lagena TaxID=94218 RepID=UPI00253F66D8
PIYCLRYRHIIYASPLRPLQRLCEILIVYLPVDLDDATVLSLEQLRGPPRCQRLVYFLGFKNEEDERYYKEEIR